MFNLITSFRASAEYTTEISDRTRTGYNRYLKLIEDEFGDMPIDVIQNPKARGELKLGATPCPIKRERQITLGPC